MRESRRIPVIVALSALLLGALALDKISDAESPVLLDVAQPKPAAVIQTPDPLTAAWYCPVGSSVQGGYASGMVHVSNVGAEVSAVTLSVVTESGQGPSQRFDLAGYQTQSIELSELGSFELTAAVVEAVGGRVIVSHEVETTEGSAQGRCATAVSDQWFLAGGSTSRDSKQYLALMNPFAEDVVFNASFWAQNRPRRPTPLQGGVVPGRSVVLIDVGQFVTRSSAMAVQIDTVQGRLVVEQLQQRDGTLGPQGVAMQLGTPAPALNWYLPAGRVHFEAEHRVLVYNPTEDVAEVDVRLDPNDAKLRSELGLIPVALRIQPGRFAELDLSSTLESISVDLPFEFGIRVEAANDVPIVAARQQFGPRLDPSIVGATNDLDELESGVEAESQDSNSAEGAAGVGDESARESADGGVASLQEEEPTPEFDLEILDDPGLRSDNETQYGQQSATSGIGLSGGVNILSTEWVVPMVRIFPGQGTVLAVTAPDGALVEMRVVAPGQLLEPERVSVLPDARSVIALVAPVPSGPLVIRSNNPVAVEVQVVTAEGVIDVIQAVPIQKR